MIMAAAAAERRRWNLDLHRRVAFQPRHASSRLNRAAATAATTSSSTGLADRQHDGEETYDNEAPGSKSPRKHAFTPC
jgi:hypothetical protein